MIRALYKTSGRTGSFLGGALTLRHPDREYALVGWGLVAGTIWLAIGWCGVEGLAAAPASLFLLSALAAVCAIDARYGIIPNSIVLAIAVGGITVAVLDSLHTGWERVMAATLVLIAANLFRAAYRGLRGFDGLGLGDVKFLGASALWIGLEGVPTLLLVAVFSALASLILLKFEGQKLQARQAISFGPHLAIGAWWVWTLGPLSFTS
jgi:leader peptidase (prepilin peptidase)/N-methyltransferase